MEAVHRVVIVGGGFGGLNVARKLRKSPVRVTLIDRRNFHLFQPLLYQVATGGLSPANIAAPLRALLKKQANAEVLLGEVIDIDVANRKVRLREGEVPYDTLVVATGVRHQYFGRDDWEPFAPGLKTVEDATAIRARILSAFEQAERVADPEANPNPEPDDVRAWLRFVVVGGGPTGVEMAGTLCELARETLRGNFRHIDPAQAEVIVVEATDRVLPTFKPVLSGKALKSLEKLGAKVRLNTRVTDIKSHQVTVQEGDRTEIIPTHTILWAAGVQASPLGSILAKATGVATRSGRAGDGRGRLQRARASGDFCDRRFGPFDWARRPAASRRRPACDSRRAICGQIDRRAAARRIDAAVPLSRFGQSGDHRPPRRRGRFGLVPFFRLVGLVGVAVRASDAHRAVPQPRAGAHAVGLELFHTESRGSVDYRFCGVTGRLEHALTCATQSRPASHRN